MYENLLNFKYALKQGNLKKVLLVVDYRMFNEPKQKDNQDFESYFDDKNIYSLNNEALREKERYIQIYDKIENQEQGE